MPEPGDGLAIIPCLNEAVAIGTIVAGVRRFLPRVVVVDDGSTDRTATAAAGAGAHVLRHERNRGKGAALATGLEHARRLGAPWAVLMDGDGQHAPEDIPVLLAAADATGADLVIGDRMHAAAALPAVRRWTNRWMSRDLSRWTGHAAADSQCGFRLVRLAAWQAAAPVATGFEIESEMLVAFLAAQRTVAYAAVRVRSRVGGSSRIHPLRDTVRWWRWRRGARRRHRNAFGDPPA